MTADASSASSRGRRVNKLDNHHRRSQSYLALVGLLERLPEIHTVHDKTEGPTERLELCKGVLDERAVSSTPLFRQSGWTKR